MRCGSTWLHDQLSRHPGIHMSDPKQLEYFDRWILSRDLRWYASFFEPPPGEAPRPVRGEVTPFYARLKRASVERIHALMPNLRIVLTIRNPIDRVWSHALYDFGVYRKRDVGQLPLWRFPLHFERERTRRYTDYAQVIDTWAGVFGEEAVHVALFDDFEADPGAFLAGVFEHVGVDSAWRPPADQLRKRILAEGAAHQQRDMPDFLRWYLARQWLGPVRTLDARLGGRVSHWVRELETLSAEPHAAWPAVRFASRFGAALPERLAFWAYDRLNDARLARRWRTVLSDWEHA